MYAYLTRDAVPSGGRMTTPAQSSLDREVKPARDAQAVSN